jgi:hypothetical protein
MEKIPCSSTPKKLRTFEDRQNFARELGNYSFIIIRLYSSKAKRL